MFLCFLFFFIPTSSDGLIISCSTSLFFENRRFRAAGSVLLTSFESSAGIVLLTCFEDYGGWCMGGGDWAVIDSVGLSCISAGLTRVLFQIFTGGNCSVWVWVYLASVEYFGTGWISMVAGWNWRRQRLFLTVSLPEPSICPIPSFGIVPCLVLYEEKIVHKYWFSVSEVCYESCSECRFFGGPTSGVMDLLLILSSLLMK